ncbi:MAG TPA: prolipoprotein diacylglyceryl transferase family protein [Steroidobacteraceae bacterium]|nr:prolipoprotein diacylglyceryl transferase family protein [Steroidobacteraceae bacterium]
MLQHFPNFHWPTPYGLMLALACVASWWFARRRAVARTLDASHVDLALPLALLIGAGAARLLGTLIPGESIVAGAALVAEHRFRLPVIATSVLLVLFLYCRVARLCFRRFADVIAPSMLLAIAILRIGCFLAGCCFGHIVETHVNTGFPWAVRFPPGSFPYRQHVALGLIGPDAAASLPVYPVQVYESAGALLLCVLVLWLPIDRLRQGTEALVAFGSYAALAFLLQFLRADDVLVAGPLTVNQFIYLAWLTAVPLLAIRIRSGRAPGNR